MSPKKHVSVRDVMKTEFDLVDGMSTVEEALRTFKHAETSQCFIVNVRNDNDEYGIVLLSDIAQKVLSKDKSPERINIYEIMSKPAIHVDPNMDIRYCSRLFEKFGLGRAPVIENRSVIGVVGYTDIVLRGIKERLS